MTSILEHILASSDRNEYKRPEENGTEEAHCRGCFGHDDGENKEREREREVRRNEWKNCGKGEKGR